MNRTHIVTMAASITALVCLVCAVALAGTYERVSLPDMDQHDAALIEAVGIPLVSTFKEEDGYGVWNLLIGQDDLKLLCYEEGGNLTELGNAHKDIQSIIDKNEGFKKDGQQIQSVTVRGRYDAENEILNLDEIEYVRGGDRYQFLTDTGDEAKESDQDLSAEQSERPAETYVVFHEVGEPWLYAPAWYHYPAWWGWYWVDVHWWWRPWYDCNLGWYVDHYCYDRHDCHHRGACGYCDGQGGSYRDADRRRGAYRDVGTPAPEAAYRSDKRYRQHDSDFRTPYRPGKSDNSRGIGTRQKSYREAQPYDRSLRSGASTSRPTRSSQPARVPTRSYSSGHQPSRSYSAPAPSHSSPSVSKPTRTRR